MAFETEQFHFMDPEFLTRKRRFLGRGTGRPQIVDLDSVYVVCKACDSAWTSTSYGEAKFEPAMPNAVFFTCPTCGQREAVKFSRFLD